MSLLVFQSPSFAQAADPIAELQKKIDAGQVNLEFDGARGYLRSLLKTLNMFQAIPDLVGSFGAFCSVSRANDVKEFLTKNTVPAAARAAQQAIERIDSCVALDMRQSKPFAVWLAHAAS